MLQIENLTYRIAGRVLLEGASLMLPAGHHAGLVGRNGSGKSTLLKLITGELHADNGTISLPNNTRVGVVAQEAPGGPESLIDTVLRADEERTALLHEAETAHDPHRIAEIHTRLADIESHRAPARAAEILAGLGFSAEQQVRSCSEFSGGWRMRVALAAALFAEPDLLLLDEPTNYLDLEGALWLEARLKKYPHTALIISHDRELLNNSVDAILHLSQGKLELYTGGYNQFETRRAEKTRLQAATNAQQDAERAHLQRFIVRFRAKASKATQAQSRIKRLAKLEPIAEVVEERVAPFTLLSPPRPLAPPLLQLEGAAVGYDGKAVLRNLNLRLDVDDRIGLLGVNGAGKSTFAKMIAGALPLQTGAMKREQRLKVGWFHQHQIEALDPEDTPLHILRRERPDDSESSRRSRLAQFGLSFDKQETTVANLSGGERARLLLNLVAMSAPHLLVLDEPTNHLDIDSRRALLDALNDYEGAVILITHDRSLIELVADRLWLTADGRIKPFAGDMDDYARCVVERAKPGAAPSQNANGRGEAAEGGGRTDAASFDAAAAAARLAAKTAAARLAAKKAAKKRRRRGL